MARIASLSLAAAAGCSSQAPAPAPANNEQPAPEVTPQDYTYTPKAERKYPPVADRAAATVGQLKARGLEQTGWDADMFACGPACDAVYAYAIFFGRKRPRPAQNEHLYTCPNPEKAMAQDEWRCTPFDGMRGQR